MYLFTWTSPYRLSPPPFLSSIFSSFPFLPSMYVEEINSISVRKQINQKSYKSWNLFSRLISLLRLLINVLKEISWPVASLTTYSTTWRGEHHLTSEAQSRERGKNRKSSSWCEVTWRLVRISRKFFRHSCSTMNQKERLLESRQKWGWVGNQKLTLNL